MGTPFPPTLVLRCSSDDQQAIEKFYQEFVQNEIVLEKGIFDSWPFITRGFELEELWPELETDAEHYWAMAVPCLRMFGEKLWHLKLFFRLVGESISNCFGLAFTIYYDLHQILDHWRLISAPLDPLRLSWCRPGTV